MVAFWAQLYCAGFIYNTTFPEAAGEINDAVSRRLTFRGQRIINYLFIWGHFAHKLIASNSILQRQSGQVQRSDKGENTKAKMAEQMCSTAERKSAVRHRTEKGIERETECRSNERHEQERERERVDTR